MSGKLKGDLEAILDSYRSAIDCGQFDEAINEVVEAIEEAGYIKPGEYYSEAYGPIRIDGPIKPVTPEEFIQLRLSGQEWLTCFKSELLADQPLHDPKHYEYLSKHALAIAERVAGAQ